MARLPGYERYLILRRAAQLMEERIEDLELTITLEEGKTITEGRGEVGPAVQTITGSAEETKRIHGETVPLDGAPGVTRQFGFTMRVPCGVVSAICPLNFPMNLVCHEVGPAIAAGNAVIIKPASDTPLFALKLTAILLEADMPPNAIQCVTGPGGEISDAICSEPTLRKITFTPSRDVGEHICRTAGLKKVTMELGSNSPLIVMPDADIEKVAQATVASGYGNAGQVCISTQRVLVNGKAYGDFLDALIPKVEALRHGNPVHDDTQMRPLIRDIDAARVGEWIQEAVGAGAPTVIADVKPEMNVSCEETFGPAVAVTRFSDINDAIALANGLRVRPQRCSFHQRPRRGLEVRQRGEVGQPAHQLRAQLPRRPDALRRPQGQRDGQESPSYALQQMTELKMVVFH